MRRQLVLGAAMLLLAAITTVAEADLISHWTFDEGSGTTAFDSAGSNHGQVKGAQWVQGVVGGALKFDGVDDCVALPDNSPVWLAEQDFTYAVWVYFDSPVGVLGNEVVLDLNLTASSNPANDNGCGLIRKDNGILFFGLTTITTTDEKLYSNQLFTEGEWYHIAALRDGTTQSLYVNGSLEGTRSCSGSKLDFDGGSYDDDGVSIGRITTNNNPNGIFFLDGLIDDVRIYDVALSEAEIRALVPEPATPLLLGLGGLALLRKRR